MGFNLSSWVGGWVVLQILCHVANISIHTPEKAADIKLMFIFSSNFPLNDITHFSSKYLKLKVLFLEKQNFYLKVLFRNL